MTTQSELTDRTGGVITVLRQHDGNKWSIFQGLSWHKGLRLVETHDNYATALSAFHSIKPNN